MKYLFNSQVNKISPPGSDPCPARKEPGDPCGLCIRCKIQESNCPKPTGTGFIEMGIIPENEQG